MDAFLEMIRRSGNLENIMLKLVPKLTGIFMRNDNQGLLVHVINSNNNGNAFTSLNHHAVCYFKKLVQNESREVHASYKKHT